MTGVTVTGTSMYLLIAVAVATIIMGLYCWAPCRRSRALDALQYVHGVAPRELDLVALEEQLDGAFSLPLVDSEEADQFVTLADHYETKDGGISLDDLPQQQQQKKQIL